ncbi:hypothetical protein FRC12_022187, partial [Ceratobasidium sp. 428]
MIIKDQSSAVWQYYEASTDDGASSSRMSHLQPEPDHRPPSPPHHSHPLPAAPSPPSRRLGLTALASTIFVVVMSAGMATFFLLFVILSQVESGRDKSAFILRERVQWDDDKIESSTLSALSVSTAISHFLSITTPLVFSLLAYRTAHLWLRAQSSPSADEEGRLPTPLHYGLLVRILNSSTILGLGSPAAYFIPRRGRGNHRSQPIPTPRLLREAFAAAFLVYLLSHAVGLADIWLHAVSTVTMADTITDANDLPDFAMAFNSSLCDPTSKLPCLMAANLKYWGTQPVVRIGSLVAANSTNPMKIAVTTLADANDTAILVPTDFVPEWNFTATTYGARAQCFKFSKYCYTNLCPPQYGTPGPASDVGMNLAEVISSMYPQAISKSGHSRRGGGSSVQFLQDQSRVMAYVGNITVGSEDGMPAVAIKATPPNPGPVLMQLRWTDFEPSNPFDITNSSPDGNSMINKETANSNGHPDADGDGDEHRTISTIWSQCRLEFVRVRYGYSLANQFVAYDIQPLGQDPGSAMLAGVLWAPLIWQQMTEQFVSNMHQACSVQQSDDSILANLEQELTRLAIGSAAGVFVRTTDTVTDASVIQQELVGRYPRLPVFVFAGLLYAYAALAILLFLSTMACTSDIVE